MERFLKLIGLQALLMVSLPIVLVSGLSGCSVRKGAVRGSNKEVVEGRLFQLEVDFVRQPEDLSVLFARGDQATYPDVLRPELVSFVAVADDYKLVYRSASLLALQRLGAALESVGGVGRISLSELGAVERER